MTTNLADLKPSTSGPIPEYYTEDQADLICALRRLGWSGSVERALEESGLSELPQLPDCVSREGDQLWLGWSIDPCPGCGEP